jgi:uncharacterized YigZ family protein
MTDNQYPSVSANAGALVKIEGSRFIADLVPVETEDAALSAVESLRKKSFDATHHCYAYIIGSDRKIFRYSDDGEPSGTAGLKIYSALQSYRLSDILCVVTRYFGGTKLGVGGLGRAYHDAAMESIRHASIITKALMQEVLVRYQFSETNPVLNTVQSQHIRIAAQRYHETGGELLLLLPKTGVDRFVAAIHDATRGSASISCGSERTVIVL